MPLESITATYGWNRTANGPFCYQTPTAQSGFNQRQTDVKQTRIYASVTVMHNNTRLTYGPYIILVILPQSVLGCRWVDITCTNVQARTTLEWMQTYW
jgi:hypothetical protein